MKKIIFILTIIFFCAVSAQATLYNYSGTLTWGGGTLVTSKDWEGASLSWNVFQDDSALWHYDYTFSSFSPAISHAIFEVSSNFDSSNIYPGTGASGGNYFLETYSTSPSNPSIPGSIYGIKFEDFEDGSGTFAIVSDRMPMWGDFYGKGGTDNYAYNLNFGQDTTAAIASGNAGGWALVPDTNTGPPVPEPSTMLLLGFGVMGIAAAGRRKRAHRG